jgi:hypothetical protein
MSGKAASLLALKFASATRAEHEQDISQVWFCLSALTIRRHDRRLAQ